MDPLCRKRNVSDGDSGFDSALSSRSSSISLDQDSPEFGKPFFAPEDLLTSKLNSALRAEFQDILCADEDIEREDEDLLLITNKITGVETLFKPPTRLKFSSSPPDVSTTHSPEDYDRNNSIPRSALFHARLEYELEKQIAKMDLVEVDLNMDTGVQPPPSLGIRVIGVNMIHGVPDKLNIYVKRIVEDSVAGLDGRIFVNDHIVEVNGISLVGVSQKLAAQTLSNCAICPQTGTVHFVLARPPVREVEDSEKMEENVCAVAEAVIGKAEKDKDESVAKLAVVGPEVNGDKVFTTPEDSFPASKAEPDFVGRDAVRLNQDEERTRRMVERMKGMLKLSKMTVLAGTVIIFATYLLINRKI